MKKFQSIRPWLAATLMVALAACGGGGGGRDPILGFTGTPVAPTVSAVSPLAGATGVPVNTRSVTAAFSEPVLPISGASSFTLTCAAPCVSPAGSVSLDGTSRVDRKSVV